MQIHRLIFFQTLIFLSLWTIIGCNSTDKKESNITEEKKYSAVLDSSEDANEISRVNDIQKIDTLEIIVVQCANGYEYAQHGYDFNPIVEKELNNFENINVQPFPLKALMSVSYQGVFDKKYCPPIIEKINVDYLILTRFDKGLNIFDSNEQKWGYELRIVNAKTLEQTNSIEAHNLKDYAEIEKHIKNNIEKLKIDIEKLN